MKIFKIFNLLAKKMEFSVFDNVFDDKSNVLMV